MSGIAVDWHGKNIVEIGTLSLPNRKRKAIYVRQDEGQYIVVGYLQDDPSSELWEKVVKRFVDLMRMPGAPITGLLTGGKAKGKRGRK